MAQLLLILERMAVTRVVNTAGQTIEYERRRPEESVFYKIVQEHIGTRAGWQRRSRHAG